MAYIGIWMFLHLFLGGLMWMWQAHMLDSVLPQLKTYALIAVLAVAVVGLVTFALVLKVRAQFSGSLGGMWQVFSDTILEPMKDLADGIELLLENFGLKEDSSDDEEVAAASSAAPKAKKKKTGF